MRKSHLLSFVFFFLILSSFPNDATTQRLAGMCLGSDFLNLEDLNRSLSSQNLGKLDEENLYLGGFGSAVISEHLLFTFEAGGFWQKSRSDSVMVKLSGLDAYIDAGYLFRLSRKVQIYPFVGVGLGWTVLKLIPDQIGLGFQEVLSNPRRISKLSSSGLVLNFGAGIQWLLYQRSGQYATENYYLGLRGGYKYMPNPSDWKMEEAEISGGPEVSFTGTYLYFYLAWGPESEEEFEPPFPVE